uniref:Integral membrane protein n=2 Tax=Streptomyces sp. NBC_00008 TaxID=2903610 RepID=A0AAU2W2P5_9ACTN
MRITVVLLAILMLVQAALAGGFLGGHYDMLAVHGLVGRVLTVVALLTAVAAFFVRRSGGPAPVFPVSVVLVVALVGQIALGEMHSVPGHVLLGVILVGATAVLTQRVMTTPLPAQADATPGGTVEPEPSK